jgi:hypothetical protein
VFVELKFQVLLPNSQKISHYMLRRVGREVDKLCYRRIMLKEKITMVYFRHPDAGIENDYERIQSGYTVHF